MLKDSLRILNDGFPKVSRRIPSGNLRTMPLGGSDRGLNVSDPSWNLVVPIEFDSFVLRGPARV